MGQTRAHAIAERQIAKIKAIDSLSRYKFVMFGYWAGVWVHLNRLIDDDEPSPFRTLVHEARRLKNGSK